MGWRVLILQKAMGGRLETGHLAGDWKVVPPADWSLTHEEARDLATSYGWPDSSSVRMEGDDEPWVDPDEAGERRGAAECGACEHEDSSVGSIVVTDPKTKKQRLFETRGVLGGAYRGKSVSNRPLLTHAYEVTEGKWGAEKSLCGKVTADHLSDEDERKWPSCKECAKKLTKLGAKASVQAKENPAKVFPPGARVLINGRDEAIVREAFPEGSTSYAFPHYKLDIVGGDKNVAVAMVFVGSKRDHQKLARRLHGGKLDRRTGLRTKENPARPPSAKRKHEALKRGSTTPVDPRVLAYIKDPGPDERTVLILATVYNDVGPRRAAVPWDLQEKAARFYNQHGLEATLNEIIRLGGPEYLDQARENPTRVANDYPDIEAALLGAQSKFDATHATSRGEAIFSPTSKGYIKRIGFREKGFYHWPEQGTVVSELPQNAEMIYRLIQVGWDPEMGVAPAAPVSQRRAAEEARYKSQGPYIVISSRDGEIGSEDTLAKAKALAVERARMALRWKQEWARYQGKPWLLTYWSDGDYRIEAPNAVRKIDPILGEERAAEEDVVFYKPGDRVLLQRYNRPGTVEAVDVDAAGHAKYAVTYTDRTGAKKKVQVAPYEVRPGYTIATEAAGTGVMRARQAVKDAQSALNDAYSRASYAGNTPEMQRKADAEIERCRTALVEAEVAVSLTSPRRPMGRDAKENPVEAGNGTSWSKITRDPKAHGAAMARAAEIGPINNGRAVYDLLSPELSKEDQEVFLVLPLDIRGQLRCDPIEVHRGARSRVDVSIPDVLRAVIEAGGEGFCVVHNHPTGNATPSKADGDLTKAIRKGAEAVDLALADHVVIGAGQYYSFEAKKLHHVKGKKS